MYIRVRLCGMLRLIRVESTVFIFSPDDLHIDYCQATPLHVDEQQRTGGIVRTRTLNVQTCECACIVIVVSNMEIRAVLNN